MKKVTSKILSVLLAMTLVFTTAGVAFADSGEVQADTNAKVAVAAKNAAAVKAPGKTSVKATSGTFALTTLRTGNESEFENMTITEFAFDADAVLNTSYKGMSNAVTIPAKGTVMLYMAGYALDAAAENTVDGNYMYYGLFYDAACTKPVDTNTQYGIVDSDGEEDYTVFTIPAAGTYYIGVYTIINDYSEGQIYAGALAAVYMNGADRTLTNNTWSVVGQKNSQTNYIKFKAANNGYVKVSTDGLSGTITLMNSAAKKAYSKAITSYSSSDADIAFGVTKGTTYTLKVTANSNYDGAYRIKYVNKKITEKSGKTRAKAVTVKRNSAKKGFIAAGSSQADWYKIKVTKKTVKITLGGATNDKIVAKLYNSKGKAVSSSTASVTRSGYDYYLKGSNMKKGTYYIKVYRANSKSSGYYTLKWK